METLIGVKTMMNITTQLSNAKLVLENAYGKEEINQLLLTAKAKIEEIKNLTGVEDELAIIKTNIKLAKSNEAKAIWYLCIGE
jgi:hypothetical protein